jgi:hypothetical protein
MPPHGWALPCDIDNDGIVDLTDLAKFASLYVDSGDELVADFNRDETVTVLDFGFLANDSMNSTT